MNCRVAVQTSPGEHPVRAGISLEGVLVRVDRSGMLSPIVAGLAELRYFADQEFGMIAAVRRMAG